MKERQIYRNPQGAAKASSFLEDNEMPTCLASCCPAWTPYPYAGPISPSLSLLSPPTPISICPSESAPQSWSLSLAISH